MTPDSAPRKRSPIVTRPYGGVNAQARREDRRQRLLAAGLAVFGRQGYHHTTVRDICAEAGLTERYFYESFTTLRALFDRVNQQLGAEAAVLTQAARDDPQIAHRGPHIQLEASLRAWYAYLQADPRRARIMLIDASVIDDLDAPNVNTAAQDFHARLLHFVEALHPDLAKYGVQANLVVAALSGASVSLARAWAHSGFALPLEDILRHNMMVFQGLDALYRTLQRSDPT